MALRRAGLCSVLVLAVAAGCGGGGGSSDSATTTATGTAAAAGADAPSIAIKEYQRRVVDAISAMGRFANTLSKVQKNNLEQLAPAFSREAEDFASKEAVVEGLTPPAQVEAAHLRLVDALQAVSRAMNDLSDAASSDDHQRFLDADTAFVTAADKVAAAGKALQAASG